MDRRRRAEGLIDDERKREMRGTGITTVSSPWKWHRTGAISVRAALAAATGRFLDTVLSAFYSGGFRGFALPRGAWFGSGRQCPGNEIHPNPAVPSGLIHPCRPAPDRQLSGRTGAGFRL